MNYLYYIEIFLLLLNILTSCNGQSGNEQQAINQKIKIVGGGCDGCEIMFADVPAIITSIDTSEGWTEKGQKLLINGMVLKPDGKTPAPDVLIYYWHTDNNGYYSPRSGMNETAARHGHLRGWMRSDKNGRYSIYTIRPASYPNSDIPAHIHLSIKEPNIDNEYYIDDFVFDDDTLLTSNKRKALINRGGNGILKVNVKNDLQIASHTIILGLNIPDYPLTK